MQRLHSKTKRRAFGYVRVSTNSQAQDGDSLSVQEQTIRLVCQLEGYDLQGIYSDPAVSGSVPFARREGGAAILAKVQSGDVIVGVKLDRCFRSGHDALGTLADLKKRGVGLHLKDLGGDVTSSNVSALVFGLLSAVAEFERSRIAERVRDVKANQRSRGRYLGGDAPAGHVLVLDPETAMLPPEKQKRLAVPDDGAVELARQLKAQGYSARSAAGAMKAHGYKASDKSVTKLWATM